MNYTNVYVPDQGLKETFFRWDNRLNRARFIKRWLVAGFISFVLGFLLSLCNENKDSIAILILSVGGLVTAFSIFTLIIRRLHDLNKSGYFALIALIPVVSFIMLLYLIFAKGTDGENRFGADPLYA